MFFKINVVNYSLKASETFLLSLFVFAPPRFYLPFLCSLLSQFQESQFCHGVQKQQSFGF